MCRMLRTRLVLGAACLAVAAGVAVPAIATVASADPVPVGPCSIKPSISVTNVDTRITVACMTIVVPIVLPPATSIGPAPAAGATCAAPVNAWIAGSDLYVQVDCKTPTAIPIPITGPPPG